MTTQTNTTIAALPDDTVEQVNKITELSRQWVRNHPWVMSVYVQKDGTEESEIEHYASRMASFAFHYNQTLATELRTVTDELERLRELVDAAVTIQFDSAVAIYRRPLNTWACWLDNPTGKEDLFPSALEAYAALKQEG